MSFFLKENFVLPNNAFQDGTNIALAGNGTVYQDGTYGYIKTFANADGAMIFSDPLATTDFALKPIKYQISYKLTSLTDGDTLATAFITYSATTPGINSYGTFMLHCYIVRSGSSYYERWRYVNEGGSVYYYNGGTNAWTAVSSDNVRTITLNTTYTLTITYHPDGRVFNISHDGSESATTEPTRRPTTEDVYCLLGDLATTDIYGQLKLDYLYIEDITSRNGFTFRNSLSKLFKKSPILTYLNNFTTRHRDAFTLKNSIIDHEPFRSDFTLLNNIGVKGRLVNLDGTPVTRAIQETCYDNVAQVFIDGQDVSNYVESWGIDYDDMMASRNVSVTVRDRAFAESVTPYRSRDVRFKDTRIEVRVNGYSLGSFFLQKKTEDRNSKSFSVDFSGPGKAAVLDTPFSPSRQTILESDDTKRGIVSSLALSEEIGLIWEIPDSTLYAGSLTVDERTPMEVIRKIAEAGGGRVITDRTNNIRCYYKNYETIRQTPIVEIESSAVIDYSYSQQIPNGENSIEVSGYEDMAITDGWATIILSASRTYLKSNGRDSCTITAQCWNEDNSVPDVDLIEDEEQSPAPNDHYEISVSKMIDTEGSGVVEIKRKNTGVVVSGPYEVLSDKRTIRVETALSDTTYQITYWGGGAASFSVNNYADISPTEVLVKDGIARATVRASSGGGGYAIVSGDYLDAQTAKITIQIADPRVGSIDVSADPSSLNPSETSKVRVKILDPEGAPAQDNLTVTLIIEEGNASWSSLVRDRATDLTTTTEIIVDGTASDPIYSNSEIEVTVRYPITALTSIYRVINGALYMAVNYASGATVVGSSVRLATPLPYAGTPIVVTYTSSGMAQAIFYAPSSVPYEGERNWIRALCGGETGTCDITVTNPGGPTSPNFPGKPQRKEPSWAHFKGSFKPTAAWDQRKSYSQEIWWPQGMGYDTLEIIMEGIKANQLTGGTIYAAEARTVWTQKLSVIILTIEAALMPPGDPDGGDIQTPLKTVKGSRKVEDEQTQEPILGATVLLYWSDAGGTDETVTTNTEGIFYFTRGIVGKTCRVHITHPDYEDKDSTITIPGEVPTNNVSPTDPTIPKETYQTCTFDIDVPYWFK